MTAEEAIKEFKERIEFGKKEYLKYIPEYIEALEMAIEALEKVEEYKRLEEQGLLLRLPCKVGDKFYRIRRTCYSNQLAPKGKYFPSKHYCEDFCPHYDCDGYDVITEDTFESIGEIVTHQAWIGRYLFLTREEAEAKLKEMGE